MVRAIIHITAKLIRTIKITPDQIPEWKAISATWQLEKVNVASMMEKMYKYLCIILFKGTNKCSEGCLKDKMIIIRGIIV